MGKLYIMEGLDLFKLIICLFGVVVGVRLTMKYNYADRQIKKCDKRISESKKRFHEIQPNKHDYEQRAD